MMILVTITMIIAKGRKAVTTNSSVILWLMIVVVYRTLIKSHVMSSINKLIN